MVIIIIESYMQYKRFLEIQPKLNFSANGMSYWFNQWYAQSFNACFDKHISFLDLRQMYWFLSFWLSSYHCLHVSFVLAFLFQHGLICNCSFIRMKNRAYTSSHTKIVPNTYLLCYKLCDIPFRIPPSEFNLNPFSSMNWLRLLISLKWDFRWWAEIVTWFSAYPLTRVQAAYSLSLCIH